MSDSDDYEQERQATIARNRELLIQLGLADAASAIKSVKQAPKSAKPVQPRAKKPKEPARPTRQSTRLRRGPVDPNESPQAKRKREREEEERRRKEEEERLEAAEREREAKRPRHNELDLETLVEDDHSKELSNLRSTFQAVLKTPRPKGTSGDDAFVFDDDKKEEGEVTELKKKLGKLKIIARAKVTHDRIYCAAYHPEPTKDLVFFGDKHGQLGIWDARAPVDEPEDDDEDPTPPEDREGGKYWRLQMHWPATSKSSISCVKFDPIDAFSVYTSAYDCTIRTLSLASGISSELYATEDTLITCVDLPPYGHEMWISDAAGGMTHMDLRAGRNHAKRYILSEQKIGSVSVNPVRPHFLVTASNTRDLKVWDTRMLETLSGRSLRSAPNSPGPSTPRSPSKRKTREASVFSHPSEVDAEAIDKLMATKRGQSTVRARWAHGKSVSSAYWDPRGRSIVSTSYDDTIRLWDVKPSLFDKDAPFPSSRPFSQIKHNCQTGKWLTILKAQWTPNPDVYPHFTIGNMDHSLDIYSCKGDHIAKLADRSKITAVQAVTCSHPSIVERVASGNASGRCVLWAPEV
ncbi:WD40 repeat-like protein [Dichomitus squalens]|uniref:WD40 repeat-like protein n=1 Tax=Dichomitus squalens (strain LYAD-421) TaxID=732165 RepID=UPI000441450A|nr:WD40 repeat-like protein [Dichomitus squalens LYAD-421 SS1]EJF66005.1 WD40 repeat-like protein [Dichomitus squalens LYAD-421 SS1]TBU45728.1 WD40 repeat-like protein [Dichomitus squalens]